MHNKRDISKSLAETGFSNIKINIPGVKVCVFGNKRRILDLCVLFPQVRDSLKVDMSTGPSCEYAGFHLTDSCKCMRIHQIETETEIYYYVSDDLNFNIYADLRLLREDWIKKWLIMSRGMDLHCDVVGYIINIVCDLFS